jgi:lipopolysaccharide transport system permease protein
MTQSTAAGRAVSLRSHLKQRFDLFYVLVERDLKLRYKRSVLGIAWALLNPLVQLVVLTIVFSLVLPLEIPNYASFLFTGLLPWIWLQSSLLAVTVVIVDFRDLIRRPGFPPHILPGVPITSNFIHYLLALPILLAFLLLDHYHLTPALLALPIVFAVQFALTLGLGYFTAALYVTFRDTQYLLGIFLLLGFYLTPVFYDISSFPPPLQALYHLNPMTILLEAYRDIFLEGQLFNIGSMLILGVMTAGLVWLGYHIFRRASSQFAEEL